MAVKLFILGFPGSGKSTLSRHITSYLPKFCPNERQDAAKGVAKRAVISHPYHRGIVTE